MNIPAFQRKPFLRYAFAFATFGFSTNCPLFGLTYPYPVAGNVGLMPSVTIASFDFARLIASATALRNAAGFFAS